MIFRIQMLRPSVAAGGCVLLLSACLPASAQQTAARVTGTPGTILIPPTAAAKGKGITIGGTYLEHSNPKSVWSVSDATSNPVGKPRKATASETTFLDPIWGLSMNTLAALEKKDKDAFQKAQQKVIDLTESVEPDAGGKGNLPFIMKPTGTVLSADTGLQSNDAIEEARASPSQTQTRIDPPRFEDTLLAQVKADKQKEPLAMAAAIFKDPEAIDWGPVSTAYYPLQIKLTGLSLSAQSVPDGIAWALSDVSGGYINDEIGHGKGAPRWLTAHEITGRRIPARD
jgi:hypothetical protein